MRYVFLAFIPIALSYACAHEQDAGLSPTQTTGASLTVWDAGPTEAPSQGWDNSKSNQVSEPAPSILKDPVSR